MAKTPNSEQLLAIEHKGGVLLRAGAGSGKTFVLVEHIIHLTQSWMEEFKAKPKGNFEEFLREKFSQVVMMTFTKKAAGEMSIRLTERFEEMVRETNEPNWETAFEALPLLTVTTIDGFCRKLITSGYFPHLSTEAKIIFDRERTEQVRELLEEWFIQRSKELPASVLEIVVREKKHLLKAFTNVFNDPGLRLKWKSFNEDEVHPSKLGSLLKMSFQLNDLTSALAAIHSLDIPEEKERSAFERMVANFQASGLPEVDTVEKFGVYAGLFGAIKVLNGERTASKKDAAHEAAHAGLKSLKKWVESWQEALDDYQVNFDQKVLPWVRLCLELYSYIETRLDPNLGMTFGDIEYFVSLGLEDPVLRERIHRTFHYFIVDEFQDTSGVQFKIIEALIGSNFNKLFCVGDAKQAIYGFRGGELSVFQDCEKLVPTVRSLANNYRSLPEIICFNNSLFRTILPLGQGFEGHDAFTVIPEDQNVPPGEREEKGVIEVHRAALTVDGEERKDFSSGDLFRLEAHFLSNSIADERSKYPHQVCTVLYRKLKPSGELIRALMEKGIGFTAQFKIGLLDDPILGMFLCLLRRQFDINEKTKDKYPLFLLRSYLQILDVDSEISEQDFERFSMDVQYWGLTQAYRKFLNRLRITNENTDINLDTIETLATLYQQDPEAVLVQLSGGASDRLSLDLRYGENSQMVQIMTAHNSKGLEFDTVYLAGLFPKSGGNNETPLFGDLPGSFIWYLDHSQREKRKSPLYVFEDELAKYKEFSESKRLFYVACTRAKKKLVWVDFDIQEKTYSLAKDSWIWGLRKWMDVSPDAKDVQFIDYENFNAQEVLNASSLPELPLFFHDPMGIFSKGVGVSELLIAPELSVTRLNSLVDCPRKFYLANVLKLTEPGKQIRYEEESEELATVMRSSSERGTYIHAQIAKGIERNFVVPREIFETEHRQPVEWALEHLKSFSAEYELVPERGLKFRLFNFMISGIPDLVLYPKANGKAQIWDFKTGRITQDNLRHYWLQLSIYAYALYQLGQVNRADEIELVLCFVDQKQSLNRSVSWSFVQEELYPVWRSQNEPWQTNPDHCGQCPYGDICPR